MGSHTEQGDVITACTDTAAPGKDLLANIGCLLCLRFWAWNLSGERTFALAISTD